jgi:hypothetical protein
MKAQSIDTTKKVLKITAPEVSVPETIHDAKIVDDNFIIKNVKSKKTGEPLQIVSMRVQIDGYTPFNATCLDYTLHLDKNVNDVVKVRVFTKDGYKNAEV